VEEFVNEKLDAEVEVAVAVEVEVVAVAVAVADDDVACTFVVELEDTVNVEEEEEDIVGYDQKYHVVDDNAVRYLIMDLMMLYHEQAGIQLTDDHEMKSREKRLSVEPNY